MGISHNCHSKKCHSDAAGRGIRFLPTARNRFFASLVLLLSCLAAPAAAEDLGRLFFTPQQRQDLDRRRAANAQEAAAIIQESTLTLQGQVSRSSGKTTTWLNGVPQQDAPSTADPARVPIRIGDDEPEITLKVGETRDLVRGETRDGLGGGKIEVLRGKPRERKP